MTLIQESPDVDLLVQEVLHPWATLWQAGRADELPEGHLELVEYACRYTDAREIVRNYEGFTDLVKETAALDAARGELLAAWRSRREASASNATCPA